MRPVTSEDPSPLARLRAATIGRTVVAVRHWVSGSSGSAGPAEEADSVELRLDDGVVLVRWAMDGTAEGLAVVVAETVHPAAGETLAVVDATGPPLAWGDLVGGSITDVRVAWQTTEEGAPPLVWAVGLVTDGGAGACIALGELHAGAPSYAPDSLVVLRADEARRYRPRASTTPAWGEPLPAG